MKGKVIDQKQPFGEVREDKMHPGLPIDRGSKNNPGATTEVMNHHHDSSVSFADMAPNAKANAMRNHDNPFAFTGMPRK